MASLTVRNEDKILMSLVHYFVTKENYSPIYVHGVKDEIWLENIDGPYRVIRINSNYIRNEEQYSFDQYKIKDILSQIKKKTMSLSINALNINLNEENDVDETNTLKNIDNIKVHSLNDVLSKELLNVFPGLKNGLIEKDDGLDLIMNVTNDINSKTENDNRRFEKIFSRKNVYVTTFLLFLNIILFLVLYIVGNGPTAETLIKMGANNVVLLKMGQIYRLFTYMFLHGSVIHLLTNMYSLYIIGNEVEQKYGSLRFILIYIISGITGGLLSASISSTISIGASGAIFGILGALLYFGFRFRLYLRESMTRKILPVIFINLAIGFMLSGIDNACHIGGLIGGYLAGMAVSFPGDDKKSDRINGIILLIIYILALIYFTFAR